MTIEIRMPALSPTMEEGTLAKWLVKVGDEVRSGDIMAEIETDKATMEFEAVDEGVITAIEVPEGTEGVKVGTVIATLAGEDEDATPAPAAKPQAKPAEPASAPVPVATPAATMQPKGDRIVASPLAKRIAADRGVDLKAITGSGPHGRIVKADVEAGQPGTAVAASAPAAAAAPAAPTPDFGIPYEAEKLNNVRKTIARRLKDAQNSAAILTTFNEVDMGAVMAARSKYKDAFEKKHGVKLGFMSFFVKAAVQALKEIPAVNAEIDGEDIVYKNYYHVGVAVGTDKGLVVPVVRNCDMLSFAGIEKTIADYGKKARDGQLQIADMQGGTFTISNGGIYGSLMSTPILNAPQSGILGMHRIEERAVVRNGQIVARPMMYLALSYDHRLVDGKEAVTFLVQVKDAIEDPKRFVLDL